MTDFLHHARRFADALLAHGTDRYGPVHTPMFCHLIDLETLSIPAQHTAAEWRTLMADWEEDRGYLLWGKDRSNLTWAHQSNLLWDTESIRLLRRLSARTGERKYADAAERYMRYFLEHCVSPVTGLFAWGEHVAYHVETDRVEGQRHELQHGDPLWEELWQISPEAVTDEIEALYRYHVVDKDAMIYDRHARYWDGLPERDRATIMGYAGIYAVAWAFLWKKTGDPKYLDWARRQFLAFQSKSDADGLYPDNWTDRDMREMPRQFVPRSALALSMFDLYSLTGERAWLDDGCRYLRACIRAVEQGMADAKPHPRYDDQGLTKEFAGGVRTVLAAFRHTHEREWLERAIELARRMTSNPMPNPQMASHMAERIHALLELFHATGDKAWLEEAVREGEYAVRAFVHPSGFIRGTAVVKRRDYYDAIQGPGGLALALWMLGETRESHQSGALPEPIRVIETPPVAPTIGEPATPTVATNREPITVSAEIAHPQGISKATLHYAVGTCVGYRDEKPRVDGSRYAFTIAPPGPAFEGKVAFAVEAWSKGPEPTRSITRWYELEVISSETVAVGADGSAAGKHIGVVLTGLKPGSCANVRARAGAPEEAKHLPAPWRAIPRRFLIEAEPGANATISLPYTGRETDRLLAETLRPAHWDGAAWKIAETAAIDRERRTVSAPCCAPGVWTLVGTNRVRWQASQREACPTAVDIDGDGRREVILTQYVNGEVLNADGTSRFVLPLRMGNRPVQNTSCPVAADIDGDGKPELVFGATSGHVHLADADGRERWKAEVGGEVRGGIVAARLPGEHSMIVGVAWHDAGLAVLNADGSVRWQRPMRPTADVTPVLCEAMPGGPALLGAAGDGLIACACADGRELWHCPIPDGSPVAPAVGEIERGGPVRIVTGDAGGRLTVLNLEGRAVASWQVPHAHEAYRALVEVGMADLKGIGRRQIIATTSGGLVWAYEADGTPVWQFVSREQETGIALGVGARLAFADLAGDGTLTVVVAEQDQYLYALNPDGTLNWEFRGAFLYHYSPIIADLEGTGELLVITTSPCENGTYALRAGNCTMRAGAAPWPTMRGNWGRTNCAAWT